MKSYEDILIEWQKKDIDSSAKLEVALSNFRILFAYHSNAIENPEVTYHNTREIFENGKVVSFTGDLRTLYEIQNQKECFEFLKAKIIEREPLSEHLIKEIHRKLMKGCYDETRYGKGERPGEYKKYEYVVGDEVGIPPSEVADEISYICEEVNQFEGRGKDFLTAAAYLHLNFEAIHPFADGNGRVGRTLMNYYLLIHNCPPTIIYNEDKAAYYMALTVFDKTEDIRGFKIFLEEQTLKTWSKTRLRKPLRANSLSEITLD